MENWKPLLDPLDGVEAAGVEAAGEDELDPPCWGGGKLVSPGALEELESGLEELESGLDELVDAPEPEEEEDEAAGVPGLDTKEES